MLCYSWLLSHVQLFVTTWTAALQVLLSMGILQARILGWVSIPSSRGSSQPRDRTQVSCIAGRFLLSEPPEKPKNTGTGSHSLLQGLFLTQGSNPDFPHGKQILYNLSNKGSPMKQKYMLCWHFLAYSMLQQMLVICCLVPLSLQKPACTSGSPQFTYC